MHLYKVSFSKESQSEQGITGYLLHSIIFLLLSNTQIYAIYNETIFNTSQRGYSIILIYIQVNHTTSPFKLQLGLQKVFKHNFQRYLHLHLWVLVWSGNSARPTDSLVNGGRCNNWNRLCCWICDVGGSCGIVIDIHGFICPLSNADHELSKSFQFSATGP